MSKVVQDLTYALRSLARNPGFALVAILTLGLGIGANSAIFSVVDSVLLRPLPFADPDRLVTVWRSHRDAGGATDITSHPIYRDWRASGAFTDVAAFVPMGANLTGEGAPERVPGAMVTANTFSVLGTAPKLGRGFAEREEQPGEDGVVVLSHGLWQRRFGGDPNAVGRTVRVRGRELSIIGVMPAGFDFPKGAELWLPLAPTPDMREARGAYWLTTIARLKPGASLASTRAAMDAVALRLGKEYPGQVGYGVAVNPIREYFVGDVRPALLVLLAAVAFVLLIACANLANLLLARAAAREQEVGLRSALGASRGRVLRQLLTEAVVLACLGGGAGLVLAGWGVRLLRAAAPSSLPAGTQVTVDARVLAFTLGVSLLTGILFGLAPALQISRQGFGETMKERGASNGGRRRRLTQKTLVVVEVALALVLLVSAGLLLQSFSRLARVDPGFRPERLLLASVSLTSTDYPEPARIADFYGRVIERVRALPGVESAGAASAVLLPQVTNSSRIFITGRPNPPAEQLVEVPFDAVSPDFFRTLGAHLVDGRFFTDADRAEAPQVAVVNQAMARRFWPGEAPVGKRFRFAPEEPEITVVGVVGDVRRGELEHQEPPSCFLPLAQMPMSNMTLVVRTQGDPARLASSVTRAVWSIDRNQPVTKVTTAQDLLGERLSLRRFNASLLSIFSLLALVLAAVGIYGVISYIVSQSIRDIGIRMALGAERGDVVRLVFVRGLTLIAIGIAAGLGSALATGQALSHLLFGVTATDLATLSSVSLVLGLLASAATYLPARRASRVDPLKALRAS